MADLHQRAEWLAFGSQGMSGPTQDRNAVRAIVIHYNGGNANLEGGDLRYANVIADMNDGYWSSRGYALGYNWMCAPDGDLWIARGTDIRCAANGCQLVNIPWVAIQMTTVRPDAEPTQAQLFSTRDQWIPLIRSWYGNDLEVHVVGHRDINPMCDNPTGTICPGVRIYPRVQAGFFDKPGTLPPPLPTGADDVSILIRSTDGDATRQNTVFITNGVTISPFAFDIDMVSLLAATGVLDMRPPASTDPLRSHRRPAAEIQNLISNGWVGPRTVTNFGGYTIPADPAVGPINKTVNDGNAAQNTILSNAFTAVDQDLTNIQQAIAAIPGGGGTGGLTEAQMTALLGRQKVKIQTVPGDADVDVV